MDTKIRAITIVLYIYFLESLRSEATCLRCFSLSSASAQAKQNLVRIHEQKNYKLQQYDIINKRMS